MTPCASAPRTSPGKFTPTHGPAVNGDGTDIITWVTLVAGHERGGQNVHSETELTRIEGI